MIERVTTIEGVRALKGEWDALYRDAGVSNLFLTHEWLAAWTAHMQRPFAVLCRRPSAGAPPEVIGAFATDHRDRWCTITEHSYRPGVLQRPGAASPLRALLLHAFTREPLVWRFLLHRMEDVPAVHHEIARALGPLRFLCVPGEVTTPMYIVDTARSFDDYLASRPSKVRQELRRKLRRHERDLPGVALVELDAPAGGDDALAVIARVEEDSWKAGADTAIISSACERAFYAAVFAIATDRSRGRLLSLAGPDGPIAYVLGVQHDDVFYALKTSYRADHAAHAPGQVLFSQLIRRLCEREPQVRSLELLGTDARWKRELSTRTRHERTFELLRPDPIGLAYVVMQGHVRPALREAAERDPEIARIWALAKRAKRRVQSIQPSRRKSEPS